jgi:putative MFS transporter
MSTGAGDGLDDARPQTAAATAGDQIVARLERLPFTGFHLHMAVTLGLGTFFAGFDLASMGVALTVVVVALHVSGVMAGLLVSGGVLGGAIGAYVDAVLAEKLGRKTAFAITLIVFGLLSTGSGLAWNFQSLLVFRVLQGIGLGGEVPIAASLFMECVRGRDRGRLVLLYESVYAWGLFLCPLVGAVVTAVLPVTISWRVLFLVGGIPLLVGMYALARLPESPRWLVDKGRHAEAEQLVQRIEDSARRRGAHLEEPRVQVRADVEPTRWLEVFAPGFRRRLIAAVALAVTFGATYIFYVGFIPTFLVRLGGLTASQSLTIVTVIGAIQLALAYVIAFNIDRLGRMPMLRLGCGLGVVASLLGALMFGAVHQTSWPVLVVISLLIVICDLMCGYVSVLWIPELFPTRMRVWGGSVAFSAQTLASFVMPIVIGALIGQPGGPVVVFAILAVIAFVALVLLMVFGVETKQRVLEDVAAASALTV